MSMKEEFILDYFEKHWQLILNVEKIGVNHSFDNYLLNTNRLLDNYAPFKDISMYQLKLNIEMWITAAFHKLILVKNSLFHNYIKQNDLVKKSRTHDKI